MTIGSSKSSSSRASQSKAKGKSTATNKEKEKRPRFGAPHPDFPNRLTMQKNRDLWLERGVDMDELAETNIPEVVANHAWVGFVRHRNRANEAIVREFYAAMYPPHFSASGVVTVRGVQVRITAEAINEYYGTLSRPLLTRGYPYDDILTPYNEQLARSLRMNGNGIWNAQEHNKLRQSQLHLDAAFWRIFCDHSLRPTRHRTTVAFETAYILYCIRAGIEMDVGTIIKAEILHTGRNANANGILSFPCLITYFCGQHGIDVYEDEGQLVAPMGNLNKGTYDTLASERGLPRLPGPPERRRRRVEEEEAEDAEDVHQNPIPANPTMRDVLKEIRSMREQVEMQFEELRRRVSSLESALIDRRYMHTYQRRNRTGDSSSRQPPPSQQ